MKITLDRILKRDADAANKKKETKKSCKSKNVSIENSFYSFFAMFSAFAINSISYKLLNCWILDCATNIHVCKNSSRFQIKRLINLEDWLRVDKTIYSIERYKIVHIVVKKSHDSINIQLLNVVLASSFLINLICLSKFIVKNVHWNTERRHLQTNEITFDYTESIEEHWVLRNNLSFSNQSDEFATFATKSIMSKSNRIAIDAEWHIMLSHVNSETIEHLEKAIDDVKIIDDSSVLSTTACETCALIKTHHVISRRFEQFESTSYSLDRVDFDSILMHRAYNDDQWVNHFICFFTHMNFVWTHLKKNDALSMIKKFVKLTLTRYEQIVRFIRINDEQILSIEYENFMKMRKIRTKRIVSYTLIQNEKIEQSERVLTMKSRALRIQTILSCELWFEFYKTNNYLNNRIFKKSLNWLIFIKILIDERSKLSQFQSYDCRVYSLRHIIARKTKMKSRTMIDHLVRYDSINVFRVWVSSKMRIIRIRDVLFDFYSFYDSCVSDIKHFVSTRMKNVIQILKILETTFDDVLIEQKNDDSKKLIFETSFKKIDELMIDLIDLQIDLKDNSTLEVNQMISVEMTSNRDLAMNDQIHLAIEIYIASKAAQHSSIDSISDVKIRFESTNSQARSDSSNSNSSRTDDFVTMNTRSRTRKQTYATTLIIVDTIKFLLCDVFNWFAAFEHYLCCSQNA
jgi:hypothetical protein